MSRSAGCMLIGLLALACGPAAQEEGMPVLGQAPSFALTDQDGQAFESASLAGAPWVADFIFTRCTNMCPMLSREMAKLQEELRGDPALHSVRFVSFSIDPDHDRPEVLREYAKRYDARTDAWTFVTGTREEMWELSKDGFKLAVGEAPAESGEPLFHSDRFVVVDASGRIRGYYSGMDSESLARLLEDLRSLADGSGA